MCIRDSIFTAGVLDFLIEKNVEFSYIIGVSAGSCNAVDFVSKQFDRTRHCLMPEKENDYMTPKAILKKRSIFDMDLIFDKYPNGIYPFDFDTYFASESILSLIHIWMRIDYFLTSEILKDKLQSASIHQEIFGSDHCPVELELEI